jgi:hypothetical protein
VQSSADTGAVQTIQADVEQMRTELHTLTALVKTLVDPPGSAPVQITALPPYPKGKAVRWNLWILDAIREEITALAAQRGLSPSQLVQELLWKALSDRRSSTP